MTIKNSFYITRYRSQVIGAVSLDLFLSHTLLFFFSSDVSELLLFSQHKNSCSFEAVHSGYVIFMAMSVFIVSHCSVFEELILLHCNPDPWTSLCSLACNSLASQFRNRFILNNLHICFDAPFHSLGCANVYHLMLIKTPTSGCSLCMLSYLLSLFFLSLRGILWPLYCLLVSTFWFFYFLMWSVQSDPRD